MASELNVFGVIAVLVLIAAALEWAWDRYKAAKSKAEIEDMIARAERAGIKVERDGNKTTFTSIQKEGE